MRKSREPLYYFTMKLTDEHYAKLANAAAGLGTSIVGILRLYIDKLPPVTPTQVDTWRKYRKRFGNEKVVATLSQKEAMDGNVAAAVTALEDSKDQAALLKRLFEQTVAEEKAKDAQLRAEYERKREEREKATGLLAPLLSAVERAELQERADNGDEQARRELLDDTARRNYQEARGRMTEL